MIIGAAGLQIVGMEAAGAAALTDVSWSVSKAHPGDTSVRYTYSFTTASSGTVASVTFSVPAGTGGSPTVGDVYGLGAGTVGLAADTLTYTVSSPVAVSANTPILVEIEGMTNTSTPGGYTSSIATRTNVPADIDTATSNTVTFDNNTTTLDVIVARTITFSNNTDNILMLMDPSLPALSDRSHTGTSLAIATNAANGYTLSARATDLTGSGETLARISNGTATGIADGSFTTNRWGFRIPTAPTNGGNGSVTRDGDLANDEWVGHTASDQTIVTQSDPTNGDTIPVSHRVKIDYLTPAVDYQSVITYTAAPSY